ncbi:transposase [Streptomyces sp. NPDC001312]|uniref:transposase n=1 Tax=Streptomyces sp. NPDC001312 TaxID=3364561 RepID=UPI0036AC8B6F
MSFLVDDQAVTPAQHAMPGTAVGIDRGVKTAVVTSDGDFHDRPFITAGEIVRYRRLQQRLARSKRGSANRHNTITAMGRIMSRVSDRRGDFCAQTAARIVAKNALVVSKTCGSRTCPPAHPAPWPNPAGTSARRPGSTGPSWTKGGTASNSP